MLAFLCAKKRERKWFQLVSTSLSPGCLPPCSATLQLPAAGGRCDRTRQDSGRSARHAQRRSKTLREHFADGDGAADSLQCPDWLFKLLTSFFVCYLFVFAVSNVVEPGCTEDVYFLENKIQWNKSSCCFVFSFLSLPADLLLFNFKFCLAAPENSF